MRRSLACSTAALSLAVVAPALGAATAKKPIAPGRIGSFNPVTNGSYAAAVKAFGKPSKIAKRGSGVCDVTWKKLALQIHFYSLSAESDACGWFASGEVQSAGWTGPKGLKVGMPLRRLKTLYRSARVHKGTAFAGSGTYWLVTRSYSVGPVFSYPALYARVGRGRVVGLGISYPSDGA